MEETKKPKLKKPVMEKPVVELDRRTKNAYKAIRNFIKALNEAFGADSMPLTLYNRLIDKTESDIKNPKGIVFFKRKNVKLFDDFLLKHKTHLINDKMHLSKKDIIKYSDRIFIDLPTFIKQSDDETLDVIKEHLLTIMSIVHPEDVQSLQKLEDILGKANINGDTKEGAFLGDILSSVKNSMENSDGQNPAAAITGLLSSGVVGKMFSGLQNGDMDMGQLFGSMQNLVGTLAQEMQQNIPQPKTEKDLLNKKVEVLEKERELIHEEKEILKKEEDILDQEKESTKIEEVD